MSAKRGARLGWLTLTLALAAFAVFGLPGASARDVTLTLVAYSTPREAYEELILAFQATEAGAGIDFDTSFSSSGEQSRAVAAGLPADVVALSLEPDVASLVDADLVAETWNQDDYNGMVADSVVVFAVREGNPKNIRTWDDLIRDDVEVITPNPLTSGGARWNIMAAYGAQIEQGKTEEEAVDYLDKLFGRISVQDKSARESMQTFLGGKGDVLIAYENEAIFAIQAGERLEYVVPDQTILIENPVAVISNSDHPDEANAFITFLRSAEAQRIFGNHGYRPVVADVLAEFPDYPNPKGLFTIADYGGWPAVIDKLFDDDGIVTEIQEG